MSIKGERTHAAILEHGTALASQLGLTGLTIGLLADDLRLSKSGLFAHFRSKEALQIQVLEHAAVKFVDQVVRPSLREPRGEPRLRALFAHWLTWDTAQTLPGGCVFAQAASELDDRAGPVRDRLVQLQRAWIGVLVTSVGLGVAAGRFRPDTDAEQFARDLYGVMLAFHHGWRLLGDPRAEARARRAFGALLDGIRSPAAGATSPVAARPVRHTRTSDTEDRP